MQAIFWFLVCWMSGMTLLRAEKFVIETGLPILPNMPRIAELPDADASWKNRSVADVVSLWKNAVKSQRTAEAVMARNWLAMNRGKDGDFYEAAVANARWGKQEVALRFLLEAARREDFSVSDILRESHFSALIKHPRWSEVRKDLETCATLWKESRYARVILTLPKNHVKGSEIRIVVGLHGYGSLPEDFVGYDFQKICDEQQVAFLAVSGRGVMTRNSFEWTGDLNADVAHIFSQIEAVKDHAKEKSGQTVIMGFSQGGQMALQLLAMHHERIRGILAMSPGSRNPSQMREAIPTAKSEKLAGKTAMISWIHGEGKGMAHRCESDAAWLQSHGAKATIREFPGEDHSWPDDYAGYFLSFLKEIN